ncbi:hypothetical protein GCM10027515_29950 [Schumannella luteola]|uniref:Uncharacterized protein n=1 Tax=Schumannella luteola TaxID=472059 RepID=A0A852YD53_9MICO|nr:hypothetical protein [Schumannella luteola]NYG99204.1 hypothetical protein [Schumannella luteola]TPX02515.1 hypothetical protein FJ656_21935 [Schumannella luteola]
MAFEMLLLAPGIPSLRAARTAQPEGTGPRAIEAEAPRALRRARAAGLRLIEEARFNDAIRLEFEVDAATPADAEPGDGAARFRLEFSPDGTVFVQLWWAGDDPAAEARCRDLVARILPTSEAIGSNPGWEPPRERSAGAALTTPAQDDGTAPATPSADPLSE